MSTDQAAAFLALHAGPGFVLPNAWDAGLGPDPRAGRLPGDRHDQRRHRLVAAGSRTAGALDRDTMLEHVGRIVAAVDVPVTADLEAGYGDTPDDVGRTVARAVELGAVGGNLEDQVGGVLFGIDEAADRIAAARAAAPAGTFVLNARTDTYFGGGRRATCSPRRSSGRRATSRPGADCIFVPGVVDEDTIRRLAAAIPAPLNVVAGLASIIDAPHPLLARREAGQPGRQPGPGRAQLRWSAPAASCSTPARSASSTAPSATPTCSAGSGPVIAVLGGHGKTGRAVCAALAARGVEARPLGRADWPALAAARRRLRGGVPHRAEPAPRRAGVRRRGAGRADRGGRGPGGLPLGRLAVRPADAAPPRQGGLRGPGPPVRARVDDPAAGRLPAEPRPERPVEVPYDVDAVFGFARPAPTSPRRPRWC